MLNLAKLRPRMLRAALYCALVGLVVQLSFAQTVENEEGSETGVPAPHFEMSTTDENGVDAISGSVRVTVDAISIGNADGGLSYSVVIPSLAHTGYSTDPDFSVLSRYRLRSIFAYDSFTAFVDTPDIPNECEGFFELAGSRTYFCGRLADGLVPKIPGGESLTLEGNFHVFTNSGGTRYLIEAPNKLQAIEYPNGRRIDVVRGPSATSYVSSDGLMIRKTTSGGITTLRAINMAVDYCDPMAASCSFTQNWPTATLYKGNGTSPVTAYVEDMAGQRTEFFPRSMTAGFSGFQYNEVKPAGSTQRIKYTFCGDWFEPCILAGCSSTEPNPPPLCTIARLSEGKVSKVDKNGRTWTYDLSTSQ